MAIASERARKNFVPRAETGTRAVSDDLKHLRIGVELSALAVFGGQLFEFRAIKKIGGLGRIGNQTLLCPARQAQKRVTRCTRCVAGELVE